MPFHVVVNTCFAWPVTINFTIFRCFLEGLSIDETVEHLLALQETLGTLPPSSASHREESVDVWQRKRSGADENGRNASRFHDDRMRAVDAQLLKEEARLADDVRAGEEDLSLALPRVSSLYAESSAIVGSSAERLPMHSLPTTDSLRTPTRYRVKVRDSSHHSARRSSRCQVEVAPTARNYQDGAAASREVGIPDVDTAACVRSSGYMKPKQETPAIDTAPGKPFYLQPGYLNFQRRLRQVPSTGVSPLRQLLIEEVEVQYNIYHLSIRSELSTPYAFFGNHYLPFSFMDRCRLVDMYYEVDARLLRCFFGNRMNTMDIDFYTERKGIRSFFLAPISDANHSIRNLIDSGVRPGSLRRQCDNLKHVCVSVTAMYRGKGGLLIPRDLPLLTAVQHCFGLRGQQATDYAAFIFGYEYRLTSKMFDRLHNFKDYITICNVVGSLWCDASGLLLRESLVEACTRMARLLDETRVLAELHLTLFDEAMRPRWQVQLDEVQRAITTTTISDKNTVTSTAAALTSMIMSPVLSSPAGEGGVSSPIPEPSPRMEGPSRPSAWSAAPPISIRNTLHSGPSNAMTTAQTDHTAPSACHISGAFPTAGASCPGSAPPHVSSASNHHHCSSNQLFTRRFLLEFPIIMKYIVRIMLQVGYHQNVNEALDLFYSRIYVYLDALSSRAAPGVVSLMLSTAVAKASSTTVSGIASSTAPVPASTNSHGSRLFTAQNTSTAPSRAASPRMEQPNTVAQEEHTSFATYGRSVQEPLIANLNTSGVTGNTRHRLRRAASAPFLSTDKLPLFASVASKVPCSSPHGGGVEGAQDVRGECLESFLSPLATVVNTSLAHHGTPLLAFAGKVPGVAPLQNTATHSSLGLLGSVHNSASAVTREGDTDGAIIPTSSAALTGAGIGASTVSPDGSCYLLGENAAPSSTNGLVSTVMQQAVGRRFLCELCLLLGMLPNAFAHLTSLTPEEHAVCDDTFSDIVLALRSIAQVLMASDDFK